MKNGIFEISMLEFCEIHKIAFRVIPERHAEFERALSQFVGYVNHCILDRGVLNMFSIQHKSTSEVSVIEFEVHGFFNELLDALKEFPIVSMNREPQQQSWQTPSRFCLKLFVEEKFRAKHLKEFGSFDPEDVLSYSRDFDTEVVHSRVLAFYVPPSQRDKFIDELKAICLTAQKLFPDTDTSLMMFYHNDSSTHFDVMYRDERLNPWFEQLKKDFVVTRPRGDEDVTWNVFNFESELRPQLIEFPSE